MEDDRDSLPAEFPRTPDGRYFVVRGRLWRLSNPALPEPVRAFWVNQLMRARREICRGASDQSVMGARRAIDEAKVNLGERGRPWWSDGAPDYNRKAVLNTPYAEWFSQRQRG